MSIATVLSLAFTAYLAATTIFIVAENRRPTATFGWILVFAVLPCIADKMTGTFHLLCPVLDRQARALPRSGRRLTPAGRRRPHPC